MALTWFDGLLPKHYARSRQKLATSAGALTALYQAIVNSYWPLLTGFPLIASTISAIPFAAAQITGNILLVGGLAPFIMRVMDQAPAKLTQASKQLHEMLTINLR